MVAVDAEGFVAEVGRIATLSAGEETPDAVVDRLQGLLDAAPSPVSP